jgi:hypothetical protein
MRPPQSGLVQVGFDEVAVDLLQARCWITPCVLTSGGFFGISTDNALVLIERGSKDFVTDKAYR